MTTSNGVRTAKDTQHTDDRRVPFGASHSRHWALLAMMVTASVVVMTLRTLTGLAFGIPDIGLLLGAVLVATIALAALMI